MRFEYATRSSFGGIKNFFFGGREMGGSGWAWFVGKVDGPTDEQVQTNLPFTFYE